MSLSENFVPGQICASPACCRQSVLSLWLCISMELHSTSGVHMAVQNVTVKSFRDSSSVINRKYFYVTEVRLGYVLLIASHATVVMPENSCQ